MSRAILIDCLPWLITLLAALAGVRVLIALRGRNEEAAWERLRSLHRDQTGAVQALSFVLTVPLFIMFTLLIVQASQLMIGIVVVHYAAFATARSAMVWIPAHVEGGDEQANCISRRTVEGRRDQGTVYRIAPTGPKYEKIRAAAVLACAPIAPSRNVGVGGGAGDDRAAIMLATAQAIAPSLGTNTKLSQRLQNKLAYSEQATRVGLTFYHPDNEPPLQRYYEWVDREGRWHYYEFEDNELGWQDTLTATVTHDFALLPGPARVLARRTGAGGVSDPVTDRMRRRGDVYVFPITASASLGNEGEKSVQPYVYSLAR